MKLIKNVMHVVRLFNPYKSRRQAMSDTEQDSNALLEFLIQKFKLIIIGGGKSLIYKKHIKPTNKRCRTLLCTPLSPSSFFSPTWIHQYGNKFTMEANNMAIKNLKSSQRYELFFLWSKQRYELSNQRVGGAHEAGHFLCSCSSTLLEDITK